MRRNNQEKSSSDFKVEMPTFDGKDDPDDFIEWLETIERVFDYTEVPEDKKVKLVALKFRGYASTLRTNTTTKRKREGKVVENMDQDEDFIEEGIEYLRQGNRFVEEYNREFEELLMRCDLQENDSQTFVTYLFGLNTQIANTVELQTFENLEELTKLALKVESQLKKRKNDPDEFLEWLETVERVFDFKEISDEKKVKIVALKFRKYASTWWTKTTTKRVRSEKPPVDSWQKMRSLLKKKFVPTEYSRDNFAKLQMLRQGTKSVEDYTREFEELLLRCDLQENEEQTFVRYLFGLNTQIANTVELQSYTTFEELTKLALKVEAQMKKSKAILPRNPRPYSRPTYTPSKHTSPRPNPQTPNSV
ncbi:unnamed protein product [Cuscuta campestris]|uniref:Retrotransposon gag domain-containing protein n=1 Tax=Cuscuta campestris TaxID=132261 RepID=A0A484MS39_9ASTE|nr:unnamed protein product [Cuscuta campestris]